MTRYFGFPFCISVFVLVTTTSGIAADMSCSDFYDAIQRKAQLVNQVQTAIFDLGLRPLRESAEYSAKRAQICSVERQTVGVLDEIASLTANHKVRCEKSGIYTETDYMLAVGSLIDEGDASPRAFLRTLCH